MSALNEPGHTSCIHFLLLPWQITTKTTQICYLTIVKVRIQHGSHWAKIKVCAGLVPSETLGKNPLPCHFQLLEAACIPGLMATSFQPLLPSLTL